MSLLVAWDRQAVGRLDRHLQRPYEYEFTYTNAGRRLSLSLPVTQEHFNASESAPFFEALLPEGALRDQIANQLRIATDDSYSLLAALGRDCAGAVQILEQQRVSDVPGVAWLSDEELDGLIDTLPRRPLGMRTGDGRLRLSLAGVQRKAVLVRDASGRYGQPLSGRPTTHILKPEFADAEFPAIAVNEFFCMTLAARCGLSAASVELATFAGHRCLVVERFDRNLAADPVTRLHQEDLCQALGMRPVFKYQKPDWARPSFGALAEILDLHGARPGADRLAVAEAALFNFVVGNADAHAKNISLLHGEGGRVRLSPQYDLVSTAVYPDVDRTLALAIGDEFDPSLVRDTEWAEFATDLGLSRSAWAARRRVLARNIQRRARSLRDEARTDGWHDPVLDDVLTVIDARAGQVIEP